MTRRRAGTDTDTDPDTQAAPAEPRGADARLAESGLTKGVTARLAGAHSRDEAEARYIAARDAWTQAMRAASSGRPADLASLAIAQESYEAAHAERERWISGVTVAIPVQPEHHDRELEAAITHELAWRVVLDPPKPEGVFTRLRRRIGGR
jgi:hypothetical protein